MTALIVNPDAKLIVVNNQNIAFLQLEIFCTAMPTIKKLSRPG